MLGLEAVVTVLGEWVDSPDVMAASRAAQIALIGSLMTQQQALACKVTHLSCPLHRYHVCNDEANSSLLVLCYSFSFYSSSVVGKNGGALANTSHMPLELMPRSPVLRLICPQVLLDGF